MAASSASAVAEATEALLENVCLIYFESHIHQTGHPAPDPLLLGMKAAMVWSHMANYKMIANGRYDEFFLTMIVRMMMHFTDDGGGGKSFPWMMMMHDHVMDVDTDSVHNDSISIMW